MISLNHNLIIVKGIHIVFRKMNNTPVVINYQTGEAIDLNETGLSIWNYLPNKISKILNSLAAEYGISEKEIEDDIQSFLNKLIGNNFIFINGQRNKYSVKKEVNISEIEAREKIKDLGMQKQIPVIAEVELLTQCNLKCIHCFNITDRAKKPLGTAGMKHIIDELYEAGTVLVVFTGGEVFSRKDIGELIEYTDKKDFLIRILTNGTLIGDKEIKILKKSRIMSVQVSIYSHLPGIHDLITGEKGSYVKSMVAIKKMIKNKIPVEIATPLMKVNFPEYQGVKRLADSLGVRHRYSYPIFERNDGSKDTYFLRPSLKEILQFFKDDLSRIVYTPRNKDEPVCGVGINTCMVNPQGDLFPCTLLHIKIGNLLKQELRKIWISSEVLNRLRKLRIKNLKKCVKCSASAYCNICLGHNWKATKTLLRPAKVSCDYAINGLKAKEKI